MLQVQQVAVYINAMEVAYVGSFRWYVSQTLTDVFPQAKEGDLAIISQVLDDPGLNSQKFQEWKQQHHELFVDICEFSSVPTEPHPEGSDLSPLSPPLMMHTHSFIETHV